MFKIFSALDYKQFSKDVFADYVTTFMKLKIHASGFERDWTLQQQDLFIRECRQDYNIDIEREKMEPNPAMRTISKLFLN